MENKTSIDKPVDGWEHRLYERLACVCAGFWRAEQVLDAFAYRSHLHSLPVDEVFPLSIPWYSTLGDDDAPPSPREMERDKQRRKQHDELLDVTDDDREEVAQAIKDIDAAVVVLNHGVVECVAPLSEYVLANGAARACEWVAAIDSLTKAGASVAMSLSMYLDNQPTHPHGTRRLKHDHAIYLSIITEIQEAVRGMSPLMEIAAASAGTADALAEWKDAKPPAAQSRGPTIAMLLSATRQRDTHGRLTTVTATSLTTFGRMRDSAGIDVPRGGGGRTYEYSPEELARILDSCVPTVSIETAERCYRAWVKLGYLPSGFRPKWLVS